MSDLVSKDDLARHDPSYRQQLMADNVDRLLAALNRIRRAGSESLQAAAQIREGADLAVELATGCRDAAPSQGRFEDLPSSLAFRAKIPITPALRRSWLGAERTVVFEAFLPENGRTGRSGVPCSRL